MAQVQGCAQQLVDMASWWSDRHRRSNHQAPFTIQSLTICWLRWASPYPRTRIAVKNVAAVSVHAVMRLHEPANHRHQVNSSHAKSLAAALCCEALAGLDGRSTHCPGNLIVRVAFEGRDARNQVHVRARDASRTAPPSSAPSRRRSSGDAIVLNLKTPIHTATRWWPADKGSATVP